MKITDTKKERVQLLISRLRQGPDLRSRLGGLPIDGAVIEAEARVRAWIYDDILPLVLLVVRRPNKGERPNDRTNETD